MSRRIFQLAALLPYFALGALERAYAQAFPPVIPRPGIMPPEPGPLPRELTGGDSLRGKVLQYVNYALTFVGLIGVIVVIYAGFLYLTSFGNAERGKQARQAIIYAVVGILLILLSYIIVQAVVRIPVEAGIAGKSTTFPDPL